MPLPFLIGFLQGAANPGPFVNWTLELWVTHATPRDRDVEIRKHIERSRLRFGKEPKRTPIDPIR